MNKKITAFILLSLVLFMGASVVNATIQLKPNSADIKIDGLPCKLNQAIPIVDGNTMVPTRLLAVEGNFTIVVEKNDIQIFTNKDGVAILKVEKDSQIAINSKGEKIELTRPAYIQSGNLHVPAKQVAKLLGMDVEWNAKEKNYPLTITKKAEVKEKISWADSLIKGIGSEFFFFLALGLIAFFAIAFFVLTPLRRRWWGQE